MSKRAEELASVLCRMAMLEKSHDLRVRIGMDELLSKASALIDAELRKERERCAAKIPHSAGAYWVPDYGNVNGAAYDLWVAGGRVSNCLNIVSDKLEKHYEQLRASILSEADE